MYLRSSSRYDAAETSDDEEVSGTSKSRKMKKTCLLLREDSEVDSDEEPLVKYKKSDDKKAMESSSSKTPTNISLVDHPSEYVSVASQEHPVITTPHPTNNCSQEQQPCTSTVITTPHPTNNCLQRQQPCTSTVISTPHLTNTCSQEQQPCTSTVITTPHPTNNSLQEEQPCISTESSSFKTLDQPADTTINGKRPLRGKITDYLKSKSWSNYPRLCNSTSQSSNNDIDSIDKDDENVGPPPISNVLSVGDAESDNDVIFMDFVEPSKPINGNPNKGLPDGNNTSKEIVSSSINNKGTSPLPISFLNTLGSIVESSDTLIKSIHSEYAFDCQKVMFGELIGNASGPIQCVDYRIYMCLMCQIQRGNVSKPEKLTLSVGKADLQMISVYFGIDKSFLAIKTTTKFAQDACQRISGVDRDVLSPDSIQPQKNYIILSLKEDFDNDCKASESLSKLVSCITLWTQLKIFTRKEAKKFLTDVGFNNIVTENKSFNKTLPLPPIHGLDPPAFNLKCKQVMFGELHGKTLAPTRLADNRIYISIQCAMTRSNVLVPERYTLSVGVNDVKQVLAYYCGQVPSFLAIEVSIRYAEVACKRIGKEVLVPGSADQKKRYIILMFDSRRGVDTEVGQSVINCLSPWTRINILSLEDAETLIAESGILVEESPC